MTFKSSNSSKLVAVDVDDVLVHISLPWVERSRSLRAVAPYVPSAADLAERLLARRQPHIQQWLVGEHGMPEELIGELDLLYRADPTFYDDLQPTTFCRALMGAMELPRRVSHVHVITHNYSNSDPAAESKERWIRRYLGDKDRVTIHHVEAGTKKSDIMRDHCSEPDVFADDSLKNVVDILLEDRVRPNEILIPRMGHNAVSADIVKLATLRGIELNYYERVT